MDLKLNTTVRQAALTVFAALIVLTSGCGDGFLLDGTGILNAALSKQLRERMGSAEVDVLEYTVCKVEGTRDSTAGCEGVSGTGIEVFVDGKSVIFDFSNVAKSGKISETGFEGYVLSITEHSRVPPILEAVVDAAKSRISSPNIDVRFDDENVAVNFQGLDYDDSTFIKVDLVFDDAT